MAMRGRIGRQNAVVERDADDRLVLRWRGSSFDLEEAVVRHRDDDGRIAFSVQGPDGNVMAAGYRRGRPRLRDRLEILVSVADEPWTWEDTDFGLFVFHVATGTGPVKYRHRLDPRTPVPPPKGDEYAPRLHVDDEGVTRQRRGGRTEHVRFAELDEVRVKFEASGVWADSSILVLSSRRDLAVAPVGSSDQVEAFRERLLPRLRLLPGWDGGCDAAVEDACEYGMRQAVGPRPWERLGSRAERPVWRRPA